MDVQFSTVELDSGQKGMVNNYIDKLDAECDIGSLTVRIKEHKKAGGRSSYTTQLRAEIGSDILVSEATDWDFQSAVREAFRKMEKKVKRLQGG